MGNVQGSHGNSNEKSETTFKNKNSIDEDNNSKTSVAAARMTRSPSGADIHDKVGSNLQPIEKLSKILVQKSQEEHGIQGICEDIFVKNVFPKYSDLGYRLFRLLHLNSKATTKHLGQLAFRQQCERFLSILDDSLILEYCIKMYSDQETIDIIRIEGFRSLLKTCFDLTMAHQTGDEDEQDSTNLKVTRSCTMLERTLNIITTSCFFSKDYLSIGYVCRWLEQNCPRLVPPIYKYCAFTLTSAYRGIESLDTKIGLELGTPILEKINPFEEKMQQNIPLLPISQAWVLASALEPMYSKPKQVESQVASSSSSSNLASQIFMAKLLSVTPTHWALLYDSMTHGVGSNRFLHHVLGYKGPNLILLRGNDDHIFCIGSPGEWRESHMYIGGDHCCVIQLSPKFSLIEHGPKMLYLNTMIRGYPKGLRAGTDPKKPIVSIDEHFEKFEYRGVPFMLISIEVWGCGDKQSRDIQTDIKKWQFKEAERQRTVKLTAADWIDHPDRYLLELGGRPNYNNSAN